MSFRWVLVSDARGLTLVMKNCRFKCCDTWWLQNICTSVGTPVACTYTIIFFAYFERTIIQCRCKNNLLFYIFQIDDIFGIWIKDPKNPNAWEEFKVVVSYYCENFKQTLYMTSYSQCCGIISNFVVHLT